MTRVKRGKTSRKKHKKELKRAKGYRLTRSKLIKIAKQANLRAEEHAFRGRKERKRNFRKLWITRISGALKRQNKNYSGFIHALKQSNVQLDRKILADLVVNDPDTFDKIVEQVSK